MKKRQLFDGKPVIHFRDEHDRRAFLRGAAVVGVGSSLAFALRGDPLQSALAQEGVSGDLDILNYALTLEQLEATFYRMGLEADLLSGRELELVEPIRDHEEIHVSAVTDTINALGGTPADMPDFTFPNGTFDDRDTFLETAGTFEELGVNAYHGQVPNISSPDVLAAAASIAGVESRHAAIIADITGGSPFPDPPIEVPRSMEFVLQQAMPFLGG